MTSFQQTHQSLTQSIQINPHLLNKITQKYIDLLQSSSNNPTTVSWQRIQAIMEELNNEDTPIQRCLLLMNVTKLIISSTFVDVNNFRQNKMYCWLGMLFGVKCSRIISIIEDIQVQIKANPDNSEQKIKQLMKYMCYGLLFSEMTINLIENTNRKNTNNKVIYPQFYRFINILLQSIISYGPLDILKQIDYERPQKINDMQQQVQEQKPNVHTTNILKILCKKKKIEAKKNKKVRVEQNIDYEQVKLLIVWKAIGLLLRSFQICKIRVLKSINIIKNQINGALQSILQSKQASNDSILNLSKLNLRSIIMDYLAFTQEAKQSQTTQNPYDQIDEQNKIIQVKQLTPRFYDQDPSNQIKKLRTKKKKLIKKIESDARNAKVNRLQEQKVIQDVRNQRIMKKQKKQLFVMQKQTQQAKKAHNKMKKIKQIQKQSKGFNKNRPGKR